MTDDPTRNDPHGEPRGQPHDAVRDGAGRDEAGRSARVAQRRAVEALRSGVPNRDAVLALGSAQDEIERRFEERLEAVRAGRAAGGLLVGGDFGSGKSHLLEYLRHQALAEGFVVSKVVVSKETPLHDPAKVFQAAVAGASVPGRRGAALAEIAAAPRGFDAKAYDEFTRWVNSRASALDERFAATLHLYQRLGDDPEFADRLVRFWAGDPIGVGELKRRLKEIGEAATWTFPKITPRELALQRFRFAARLMAAAGFAGWVLLFDEVELIGRYSLLQRARSYAELARWVAGFEAEPLPALTAVLAITDDFDDAVLYQKHDRENVPNRLRARQDAADELTAVRAEQGMRLIERELLHLLPPTRETLEATYRELRRLHGEAYEWQPPELPRRESLASRSMREHVRAWIQGWDLRRLDPGYQPTIEVERLETDYSESPALEEPPEGEAGPESAEA